MPKSEQFEFIDTKEDKDGDVKISKPDSVDIKLCDNHLKYRLLKTFFLFLSWICLGLFSEILGPALPSLRNITDTNYEEISRALSARAGGLLSGSLIGGLLSDRFLHYRSFLVFIFLSLAGITVATIPLCRSLVLLSFNLFISGFSHGAFTTAGNPLLGSLWKKPTGPYNFMHSGYGLGAAVAPLLLTLFDNTKHSLTLRNHTLTDNVTQTQATQYIQPSFNFVAIFCIIVGFIFLTYSFVPNPVDELEITFCRKKHRVGISKHYASENGGDTTILGRLISSLKSFVRNIDRDMVIIFLICFISYFGIVGNERVFGKFQFTYATEGPLKISKSQGYVINGLYWVSFCMARIIMAVVAIKVSSKVLLVVEISGAILSSTVFTIWSGSQLVFLIFSTSFGFFKSPLFPTMLGVLSLYTTISGMIVILVNFGSAAGAMSCQYLAGYLMQYYGHYTFPLTVTFTGVLLAMIFTILLVVTRKWKQI